MSTLPKIPLDSSSDLAYLRSQLQQALSTRLRTHLPNALPEDSFRTMIETHISSFLRATMEETVQNITINGLDPLPSHMAKGVQVEPEPYEPFDTVLQSRVLAKHAALEATIERVTRMRREVPVRIKALREPHDMQEQEQEEQAEQEEDDEKGVNGGQEDGHAGLRIARLEEVRDTYTKSCAMMHDMSSDIARVTGKTQRARDVLAYIQRQQQQQQQQEHTVPQ